MTAGPKTSLKAAVIASHFASRLFHILRDLELRALNFRLRSFRIKFVTFFRVQFLFILRAKKYMPRKFNIIIIVKMRNLYFQTFILLITSSSCMDRLKKKYSVVA